MAAQPYPGRGVCFCATREHHVAAVQYICPMITDMEPTSEVCHLYSTPYVVRHLKLSLGACFRCLLQMLFSDAYFRCVTRQDML